MATWINGENGNRASGCPTSPCRFFDSDADAMTDMKRLAGVA